MQILDFLNVFQDTFKVLLGFFTGMLASSLQENSREKKETNKLLKAFYGEIKRDRISIELMIEDDNFALLEQQCLDKIKFNPIMGLEKATALYSLEIGSVNNLIKDYLIAKQGNPSAYTPIIEKKTIAIHNLREFRRSMEETEEVVKKKLIELKIIKDIKRKK